MKAIYIKPETEKVSLQLKSSVNADDWGEFGDYQTFNVGTANEDSFFDEEEIDDEYDPFFDD